MILVDPQLKHINKQMVNVSAFLYEDKAKEYVDKLNNRMSVMKSVNSSVTI